MKRIIKSMEQQYLIPSSDLVEDVFTKSDSKEEGQFDVSTQMGRKDNL